MLYTKKNISVQFVIEESSAAALVSDIKTTGGNLDADPVPFDVPPELIDDYGDAQFEPFLIVAAAVSIGFLIKRISDVILDHKMKGGYIVDARNHKLIVRRAPYLNPRGSIVLLTNKNEQFFQPEDKDQALEALEKMIQFKNE